MMWTPVTNLISVDNIVMEGFLRQSPEQTLVEGSPTLYRRLRNRTITNGSSFSLFLCLFEDLTKKDQGGNLRRQI